MDRDTGERQRVTLPSSEGLDAVAISGDGSHAAFTAYPGNTSRLLVWSRQDDAVRAEYPLEDGTPGALSADGRYLVFSSRAEITDPPPFPLGGVVVADLETGEVWQASVSPEGDAGTDYSSRPDITDDGRFTVFGSVAPNLVAGKPDRRWDAYLYDRRRGHATLAAPSLSGGYPDDYVQRVRIAGDGTTLAFDSAASDVVSGDGPGTPDLFLRDLEGGEIRSPTVGRMRASIVALANLSRQGRFVLFATDGDGLLEADDNGRVDVFAYDSTFAVFGRRLACSQIPCAFRAP